MDIPPSTLDLTPTEPLFVSSSGKYPGELADDELRARGFRRITAALWSFWEEQKDIVPRAAYVHSRIFDTLIHDPLITVGTSRSGGGHREHVVPCAYIRDLAFDMFWNGASQGDVERTVARLLRIAHIHPEEAKRLDRTSGLKTTMPPNWNPTTDSILARLDAVGIRLLLRPASIRGEISASAA